ncbi:SpoIIE family protein phosphatase [Caldicoprobacter algeriensis]|uniref:SpoIIE family protein phosphatase n=1 Tax=Caldicoprobacter algeriensis TaxID=699281 RepID=UPI00207ADD31|nr:SpoIIE family protein phosphatase [Caldicoprobacter algeriensis]MCM8900740.1 SpoIIE family protein phosphatase [Caldicoprobacter algeriensis]
MKEELKVDIKVEADLFILEYKINRYIQQNCSYISSAPLLVLVAKELATNILKYGGRGFIALKREKNTLAVIAEDEGNLSERRSTSKRSGLGIGLDVTRNCCDKLVIEQKADGGLRVEALFSLLPESHNKGSALQVGTASRPHYLEEENGDVCIYRNLGNRFFLFLADVLGHGKGAGAVANMIEDYINSFHEERIERIYSGLEELLRDTRGCAAFMAFVSECEIEYVNIGNIKGWIVDTGLTKKLKNTSGIIGRLPVSLKVFKEPILTSNFILVVCSDGIKNQFIPTFDMKWLKTMEVDEAAQKILREFSVKEDDASVLVARGGIWS